MMQGWKKADPDAFHAFCDTVDVGIDLTTRPDEAVTLGVEHLSAAAPSPGATAPDERTLSPDTGTTSPDSAPIPRGDRSGAGLRTTPDPVPEAPKMIGAVEGFDFEVRSVLGEGGMARVHLGWQRSVGREVAIKVPRPGMGHTARIAMLVREARITGRLEHPNVPPMYGLGRTVEGTSVMTMRRIEGVSWRDALDDPAALPERFHSGDHIESHLRILMDVCDAVHFAHSRGVLHRDVKPDNVMLGAFGEVYLVDWGLAVVLDDSEDLPRAADVSDPAGTPAYMAPEMAAGDGPSLGVVSDVYTLGAVLHRILVGQPRHVGVSYLEVLTRAWRSAPFDYPPSVPARLAAICARATAREPADRFPDAAAFREAIADFLEQRSSSRLVEEAAQAIPRLAEARADGDDAAVERHFGAARFALEHALRVWPENADARHTLDGLLLDQAAHALAEKRGSYAEGLIASVHGEDAVHAERREALTGEAVIQRERQQRLGRLAREADLSVFSRHRGLVALFLGVAWGLNGLRRVDARPTVYELVVDQLWMAGLIVGLVALLRRWLWSTEANRRVSLALMSIIGLDLCVRIAGWKLGLEPAQVAGLELSADVGGVLFLALLVDRRLLFAVAIMATGAWMAVNDPEQIFRITAWTVLVTLTFMGFVWLLWPSRSKDAPDDASASR